MMGTRASAQGITASRRLGAGVLLALFGPHIGPSDMWPRDARRRYHMPNMPAAK
jgi:hypothetical protein